MGETYPSLQTYGINPTTGLPQPFTVVMDRDELRTNTAAMTDARDLVYSIGPNETIVWKFVLILGGNSPGNVQVGFYTPAAPVSGGWIATFTAPGAVSASAFGTLAFYNVSWTPLENNTGAGDEFVNLFEGRLVNGANGGFFRLQWAQNAANLAPSRLLAGSRMDIWRFAP